MFSAKPFIALNLAAKFNKPYHLVEYNIAKYKDQKPIMFTIRQQSTISQFKQYIHRE